MKIAYSDITNGSAKILQEYVDKDYLEKKYTPGLHTGVDIEATSVYSISPGIVKLIGSVDRYYNVIIAADQGNAFNYCHLKSVAVEFYDDVELGTYIGEADSFVHFEYLNTQESRWPVRIGTDTWYKHDPISVVREGYYSVMQPVVTPSGDSNNTVVVGDTQVLNFDKQNKQQLHLGK